MVAVTKLSWRNILDKLIKDDVLTQAAALAFYMGSAVVPLFVLLISFLAILDQALVNQMAVRIKDIVGDDAAQIFQSVSAAAHGQPHLSSWSGIVGILVLIISTSVIFRHVESVFSLIFKQPKAPAEAETAWGDIKDYLKRYVLAILMMVLFLLLTVGSVALSVSLSYQVNGHVWIFKALNVLFDLSVFTLLFACAFKLLLLRPVKFIYCLAIGFIIALFFAFGKDAISFYLRTSAINSAYGAAGFPMALFVWLYYSACVIFFGAEALSIFWMKPNEKT